MCFVFSRLFGILFGIGVGAVATLLAHEFHIVRSRDDVLLVRKKTGSWQDIYVDIRAFSTRDWRDHKELSQNMVAAGHGKLVGRSSDLQFPNFMGSFREKSAPSGGTSRE